MSPVVDAVIGLIAVVAIAYAVHYERRLERDARDREFARRHTVRTEPPHFTRPPRDPSPEPPRRKEPST